MYEITWRDFCTTDSISLNILQNCSVIVLGIDIDMVHKPHSYVSSFTYTHLVYIKLYTLFYLNIFCFYIPQ